MPREYHMFTAYDIFNRPKVPYEHLYFFMYEEMGISAPTLYRTMITQEQADGMWKNTKTTYWKVPALGRYLQPIAAPPIDTPVSGAV